MSRVSPEWSATVRTYVSAQALWAHAVATAHGLSSVEFATLNLIDLEGPVTSGRVAELTGLSAAATTRLVDRLTERGFAQRHADERDRRRVLVSATQRWRDELSRAVEPHRQAMRTALADMDAAERDTVLRYLDAMGRALRDI